MLSRVAERIYWMGRYVERAENTARIINVNTNLLLDLPKKVTLGWQPLIDITGIKKLYNENYPEVNERNVVKFLIADTRNFGSLVECRPGKRPNHSRRDSSRRVGKSQRPLFIHQESTAPGIVEA